MANCQAFRLAKHHTFARRRVHGQPPYSFGSRVAWLARALYACGLHFTALSLCRRVHGQPPYSFGSRVAWLARALYACGLHFTALSLCRRGHGPPPYKLKPEITLIQKLRLPSTAFDCLDCLDYVRRGHGLHPATGCCLLMPAPRSAAAPAATA